MRLALLSADDREARKCYGAEYPILPTAQEALLQGLEKQPDLEVHFISCLQQPVNAPVKLADNVWYHALHVPKIGWLRTGYQGCLRATRRKLREIGPDLVHGQGTERECALSAVFSGYPNVITIHGNMRAVARGNRSRPFSFDWLAARLEAWTIPRAGGVVCITNYTRAAVASLARKTWVAPNAVDLLFFGIKREWPRPARVLCVGNVTRLKNQNALIRALDDAGLEDGFELVFLGRTTHAEADYTREFLDLVATRSWCRYEGFVDRETLRQKLASASGLVLPTLEDNCPMVVLEAMAAGVPVAAAQVGGVPELIRHGETGLLFDPGDKGSMASAVKGLLADSSREMAARARDQARQRFHPDIIARRHVEIYREMLSACRSSQSIQVHEPSRSKMADRVNVLGVGIDPLNLPAAVAAVGEAIRTRAKGYVCVTGVHGVSEAQDNPAFRAVLNRAALNTPDGMPMVWMGRWRGRRKMDRVYGPDLLLEVCRVSEQANWRHFFYGGAPGVAEQLASALQSRFPKLTVAGTYAPPFRPLEERETEDLRALVAEKKPDIIWVGLSTPKQEIFMAEILPRLDTTLMIGVGAAFDLLSGRVRQAPRWVQRSGFEWLYRLVQEPGRLWKRYLRNNPLFVWRVFLQLTGLRGYEMEEK